MNPKKRVSKEFDVRFDIKPKRPSSRRAASKEKSAFEFFVEHFGQIEVAPRYRITVEVVK